MSHADPATPDATLRVRLGTGDTHYRNHLIPAATVLRLFADCSTEIGLRETGHPGLLAAYENAEFLQVLRVGDYLEIQARVASRGNRSRRIALRALRHIRAPERDDGAPNVICDPPELVARAVMISVRPK
ncbi:MAG: hypothetical protein JO264_06020 [Acidisphaera sp.]|nr:hypothetical protein [Acidisphaera sp.]